MCRLSPVVLSWCSVLSCLFVWFGVCRLCYVRVVCMFFGSDVGLLRVVCRGVVCWCLFFVFLPHVVSVLVYVDV